MIKMSVQEFIYRNMYCRPRVASVMDTFGQVVNRAGIKYRTGLTRDMAAFAVCKDQTVKDRLMNSGSVRAWFLVITISREMPEQEMLALSRSLKDKAIDIPEEVIRAVALTGMGHKQVIKYFCEVAKGFEWDKKKKWQRCQSAIYVAAIGCLPAAIAKGHGPQEVARFLIRIRQVVKDEEVYSAIPVAFENRYELEQIHAAIMQIVNSKVLWRYGRRRLWGKTDIIHAIFSARLMAAHVVRIEEGFLRCEEVYERKPRYQQGRYKLETFYHMPGVVTAFMDYVEIAGSANMPADKITERSVSILGTSTPVETFEAYVGLVKGVVGARYDLDRIYSMGEGIYTEYVFRGRRKEKSADASVANATRLIGACGFVFGAAGKNCFTEEQAIGLVQRFCEIFKTTDDDVDVASMSGRLRKMAEFLESIIEEELTREDRYTLVSRALGDLSSDRDVFDHLLKLRKAGVRSGELLRYISGERQRDYQAAELLLPELVKSGPTAVENVDLLATLEEKYPGRTSFMRGFPRIVQVARVYDKLPQRLDAVALEEAERFPFNTKASPLLYGFQYPEVEEKLGFPIRQEGERYSLPDPGTFISSPTAITNEMLMQYAVTPHDMDVIRRMQNELVAIVGGTATYCLGSTARGTFLPVAIDFDIMFFDYEESLSGSYDVAWGRISKYQLKSKEFQHALDNYVKVFFGNGKYSVIVSSNPSYFCSRLRLTLEYEGVQFHFADISFIDKWHGDNMASKHYYDCWCGIASWTPVRRELLFRNVRLARHIIGWIDHSVKAMIIEQAVLQSDGSFAKLLERFYAMGPSYSVYHSEWPFNFSSILDTGRINFGAYQQRALYDLAARYHAVVAV